TVAQEDIFGVPDSVKQISLLTQEGDTVHRLAISQTYGVVRGGFMYEPPPTGRTLTLAGTSQDNLGRQLPADSTYGQVAVGDTYHIEKHAPRRTIGPDDTLMYDWYTQQTYTVLSLDSIVGNRQYFKTVGDRLQYRVRSDGSYPPEDSTLVRDVVRVQSYAFPEAMEGLQPGQRAVVDSTEEGLLYRIRFLQEGVCGLSSTRFSDGTYFPDRDTVCGSPLLIIDGGPEPLHTPFVPETVDTLLIGMYPERDFLRYLMNDQLECGEAYDFSDIILAVADFGPATRRQADLFPNPASNDFSVSPRAYPGPYELRMYSLSGSLILARAQLQGREQISLAGIPRGAYVVVVLAADGSVARNRLIVR
ncbi:MAG: T9SS type A sorting domain-containing protein, partial [Lewinella sp.]